MDLHALINAAACKLQALIQFSAFSFHVVKNTIIAI